MNPSKSSSDHNTVGNTGTRRIQIPVPRPSPTTTAQSNSLKRDYDDDDEAEFEMVLVPTKKTGSTSSLSSHTKAPPSTISSSSSSEAPSLSRSSSLSSSSVSTTKERKPRPSSNRRDHNTQSMWESLRKRTMDFAINVECTSLCLSPSGNFLWAGFSDGTLRVFDLTGRFSLENDGCQASRQKSSLMVASKFHQGYGAVACQIHARGVHTDLLMQVDACGDYVFGGVPRGAMELYAVSTRELERAIRKRASGDHDLGNILDYLQVHVHADAKLKGFGACTQLRNASRPTYLLLTGKGIKNIHIWKFQPPLSGLEDDEAIWEQLYDTQTNGNTINLLSFYRNPLGKLLGVSQSDTQKVRLWDLSLEEDGEKESHASDLDSKKTDRPKRPPYEDVVNSQGALGIAGGYGVCGGPTMYNQLGIVSLDQPKSAYNHMELALPGTNSISSSGPGRSSGRGRQRRGDLKQVINVATLPNDSNHALLELDDGSIVHYTATDPKEGRPNLRVVTMESSGVPSLPADFWCRTLCLGSPAGVMVAAISMYNPNTQGGQLLVRALQPVPLASPTSTDAAALKSLCMQAPSSGAKKKKKSKKRLLMESSNLLPRDKGLSTTSDTAFTTPKPTKKKKKLELPPSSSDEAVVQFKSYNEEPLSIKSQTNQKKKQKAGQRANSVPPSAEKTPKRERKMEKSLAESSIKKAAKSKALSPISQGINGSAANVMTPASKATVIPSSSSKYKLSTPASKVSTVPSSSSSSAKARLVPPSGSKSASSRDHSSTTGAKNQTKHPCSLLAKVSPGASTPSPDSRNANLNTPSSTDSSNPERGSISKFMKPKRVLHQWPDKDSLKAEKAKMKSKQLETATAMKGGMSSPLPMPLKSDVASPPVPRKARKMPSVDQSLSAKTEKIAQAGQFDGVTTSESTQFEIKVRKTLKIRIGTKPEDLFAAKKEAEGNIESINSEKFKTYQDQKGPRKSKSEELDTKKDVANLTGVSKDQKLQEEFTTKVKGTSNKVERTNRVKLKGDSSASGKKRQNEKGNEIVTPKKSNVSKRQRLEVRPQAVTEQLNGSGSKTNAAEKESLVTRGSQNAATAGAGGLTRDEMIAERVAEEYRKLQVLISRLPKTTSRLLRRGQNVGMFNTNVSSYAWLAGQHRSSHDMVQKRLLRAAESTLRSLLSGFLSVEEARNELKATIKSYEEVVYVTLKRQELEMEDMSAREGKVYEAIQFPFQSAFKRVEAIYQAIEPPRRPPGRPKSIGVGMLY